MIKSRSLFLTIVITAIVTLLTILSNDLRYFNSNSYLKVHELRSLYSNLLITPKPCATNDLVIIIHSAVKNAENRDILRRFIPSSFKTVFVIGRSLDSDENIEIEKESNKFGDVLLGSFIDSYHNMTVKHLTGYHFIHKYCRRAAIILKIDDDIFVNFKKLQEYLDEEFPIQKNDPLNITDRVGYNMFRCFVIHRGLVVRSKSHHNYQKWAVPENIYKDPFYPDYCSGWAYITTVGAIDYTLSSVEEKSPYEPVFWIDDIYVTAMLKDNFGISMEPMNPYFCHDIDQLKNWLTLSEPWPYMFSNTDSNLNLLRKSYEHSSLNFSQNEKKLKLREPNQTTGIGQVFVRKL